MDAVSSLDSPRASRFADFRALWTRYLQPQTRRVVLLAVLLFSGIAAQLVTPQIIRTFLDTAQAGQTGRPLLIAALMFIGFTLLQQGLGLAANYTATWVGWTATNHLRIDLTLHALRLDMDFHKRRTPGEMIERIDGDVTRLAEFFSQFILLIAGNGLLVIGILVLLFREDLRLGIGLTFYTGLVLVALRLIQGLAVRRWEEERRATVAMNGYIEERISGAEEIRVLGAEQSVMNRLYRLMRTVLHTRRRASATGSMTQQLTNLLDTVGYVVGLALGIWLYRQGHASLGTAYLIVNYIGMLEGPIQTIRNEAQNLQQATASVARVMELLRQESRVEDAPRKPAAGPLPPGQTFSGAVRVQLDGVSFRYEDGENVLSDVSFELEQGKVLGVLGRTGSGKTTLTRLLFRLYDPQEGVIRLDDRDLRSLPVADLRRKLALVTQDVQLFHAPLRDNLRFFDETVSDDRLRRALEDLQLWEWVSNLPHGLNTMLGSSAQGFSAGEAQLLAFARVFLKDPALVILDEASSRLDPSTEARMERAIDRLFAGRTGVIIAHRLHTVQRADSILILESGRAVEFGPREALAADPSSRFAALLRAGMEEVLE